MKLSEFFFDFVQLLYYKFHKINHNCAGSYTVSPDLIKKQIATINTLYIKKITNVFNTL